MAGGPAAAVEPATTGHQPLVAGWRFLGETGFPTGHRFDDTVVGGLSGIEYLAGEGRYLAISDDRSRFGEARFYTLTIDLADGDLDDGDIVFVAHTTLRNRSGQPFAPMTVDPEAIRRGSGGTLFWVDEGPADQRNGPRIVLSERSGQQVAEFGMPRYYTPSADQGVRPNLALESLALVDGGRVVVTATENALRQDGPRATPDSGSPARLLLLDAVTGDPVAEYVYPVDPVPFSSFPPGLLSTQGLVELVALDGNSVLAVERAYAVGRGNGVRLYEVSWADATDVLGRAGLGDLDDLVPVDKRLVVDLGQLGIELDNIEGATLGPYLGDGERVLILVADNNFRSAQRTQFIALAMCLRASGAGTQRDAASANRAEGASAGSGRDPTCATVSGSSRSRASE